MKQAQAQSTSQLRSMLLDPTINLVFQRMMKEMEESQEKLKQTQNELSAWKFTPDRCLNLSGNIYNVGHELHGKT